MRKRLAILLAFLSFGCSSANSNRLDESGPNDETSRGVVAAGRVGGVNILSPSTEKASGGATAAQDVSFLRPAIDFLRSLKIKSDDDMWTFGLEFFERTPGLYFGIRF